MPTPRDGESRDAFMSRCVPQLIDEGKEQAQAVAICSSMFQKTVLARIEKKLGVGDAEK